MGCCSSKPVSGQDTRRPQLTPAPSMASTTSHRTRTPNHSRHGQQPSTYSANSYGRPSSNHAKGPSVSIAGSVVGAGGPPSHQHSRNNTTSNQQHSRSQRGTHSTTFTEMLERAGFPDPGRDNPYQPTRNVAAEIATANLRADSERRQAEYWQRHKRWGA
ncbi:hypothetical protein RBB50_008485 [Rhinocladiella similis]